MYKLYLILPVMFIYCNISRAQDVFLKSARATEPGNEINLEIVASFYPVTSSNWYSIQIVGQDTVTSGNQYKLKLYYYFSLLLNGIPGRYDKIDTVSLGVLQPDIKEVIVEMYTIQEGDTVPDTIWQPPPISIFLPLTIGNTDKDPTEINIYPNPTKNTVTVSAENPIEKVEISNLLGEKLLSQKGNSTTITINLEGLATGVYIIKVNDSFVRRVVKE